MRIFINRFLNHLAKTSFGFLQLPYLHGLPFLKLVSLENGKYGFTSNHLQSMPGLSLQRRHIWQPQLCCINRVKPVMSVAELALHLNLTLLLQDRFDFFAA